MLDLQDADVTTIPPFTVYPEDNNDEEYVTISAFTVYPE